MLEAGIYPKYIAAALGIKYFYCYNLRNQVSCGSKVQIPEVPDDLKEPEENKPSTSTAKPQASSSDNVPDMIDVLRAVMEANKIAQKEDKSPTNVASTTATSTQLANNGDTPAVK